MGRSTFFTGTSIRIYTQGELDVDMNAGGGSPGHGSRSAVENITYPDRKKMIEGVYTLYVCNYRKVENQDFGFEVEVEFDGVVHTFSYAKALRTDEKVVVTEFFYTHKYGFKLGNGLKSEQTSKQVWGLQTQTFQKVNVLMLSPNYWDTDESTMFVQQTINGVRVGQFQGVGNKHYFFMLSDCRNEGTARGFYNEFLDQRLEEHRKVFEMVGAKMRTEETERQLSGLGFSSTQRNSLMVRITGKIQRILKVVI